MPKIARLLAWTLAAALVFATLAPIGLRPVLAESADLERALAYGLFGVLLSLAYPRHRLLALAVGIAVAAGLEAGQLLTASRHGRLDDFLVKAAATGLGVAVAQCLLALGAYRERRRALPQSLNLR